MSSQSHSRNVARRASVVLLGVVAATALPFATRAHAAVRSAPVSVIVRGHAGCADAVAATVRSLGGRMSRPLPILDGGAARVPGSELAALSASPCVAAVSPDANLKPASIGSYDPSADTGSLYNTTQIINAQRAWSSGYTGKGVGVALIDTGVAPVSGINAPGQLINGPDLSFDSQSSSLTYNDEYGHGTHLAGIIAGNDLFAAKNPAGSGGLVGGVLNTLGSSSKRNGYAGNSSNFLGVAPDAHILNMKVGDENGVVDVSQVIAAIDWVVQHRNDSGLNIKVLNLSYGTLSGQAYSLDPLAYAAEVAWRNGIVVVAAVGNGGNGTVGLDNPAYDPFVLAVGAADTAGSNSLYDDSVAGFSNSGDGVRNPDLVAPGVHLESLRDPGSNIDLQNPQAVVGDRFFLGSGTSQAAAVVSGAVALYYSAHPDASPDYVKKAFTTTATPLNGQPATLQGAGEVNVMRAIDARARGWKPQQFSQSSGSGSLETARGGMNVVAQANGAVLSGEMDIMGNAFDTTGMAAQEANTSAWNGGSFNGAGWSGAGWSGAGWSGAAWSGAGWSGAGWSGAGWSGSTWTGAGWSGAGWSGAGWSGAGWSGAGWSGAGWSGAAWSGAGWSNFDWS
jgi:serine protease AprX